MITTTNPNQALWKKGDFTRIAATMRESGDALVEKFSITPGLRVLDVGCGDGTTALPAAQRGAEVLGVDLTAHLVEAGNRRAREHGLTRLSFQQGDVTDLHPLPDNSFDLVVSIFGAMFAPRPFEVAQEMVRVTRAGGRIIMGNWIPNDPTFVAQILKICSAYTPPPPEGFVSPMRWGVEADVTERFARAGIPRERVSFARETFTFHLPAAPSAFLDLFRNYYGPTMNAYEAAERSGRVDALHRELSALFARENLSPDPNVTLMSATYLLVTVMVDKTAEPAARSSDAVRTREKAVTA
jgi:SAM-dependent methyltransferase